MPSCRPGSASYFVPTLLLLASFGLSGCGREEPPPQPKAVREAELEEPLWPEPPLRPVPDPPRKRRPVLYGSRGDYCDDVLPKLQQDPLENPEARVLLKPYCATRALAAAGGHKSLPGLDAIDEIKSSRMAGRVFYRLLENESLTEAQAELMRSLTPMAVAITKKVASEIRSGTFGGSRRRGPDPDRPGSFHDFMCVAVQAASGHHDDETTLALAATIREFALYLYRTPSRRDDLPALVFEKITEPEQRRRWVEMCDAGRAEAEGGSDAAD